MYTTAGWENFFVAEVSAAAALTGLLFVAVSINLTKILSFPQLPGRAGESLVMLMGALMVSTFGLVPQQPRLALGAEILGVGLLVWLFPMRIQRRAAKMDGHVHAAGDAARLLNQAIRGESNPPPRLSQSRVQRPLHNELHHNQQ